VHSWREWHTVHCRDLRKHLRSRWRKVVFVILINVRFRPLPEYLENFREVVSDFTDAARAEDGCLFFQWYRNTDDPEEYLLIEIYKDGTDVAHVESDHFKAACEMFPTVLKETPEIINDHITGKTEWDRMAEFSVD
jgi:quinol monooxygenase YgiN